MTRLENWLKGATRCLSAESGTQARREIAEHYESTRESALHRGMNADEADRLAVTALGDPKAANRQYRRVLLTSAEARFLHRSNREAQVLCARPWRKWLLLAAPAAVLLAAMIFLFKGAVALGRDLLVGGLTMGLVFAAPFLPVYTPSRSRVFRGLKWTALIIALVLILGPIAIKMSWLLPSCLWPLIWIEWTRVSIRRKLPVAQWPKQLYL